MNVGYSPFLILSILEIITTPFLLAPGRGGEESALFLEFFSYTVHTSVISPFIKPSLNYENLISS